MKNNKIDVIYEKNYQKRFLHLNEEMKSKYCEMVKQVTTNIAKYIKLQNQLNSNIKNETNLRNSRKKQYKKISKTIKNGEHINDFDDNKLIIDYFYNEKSNKLIVNNLYLYKKISSTESFSKRSYTNIADGVLFCVILLMFICIHFTQGYLSKNTTLLWPVLVIYIFTGGIFLFFRYKIFKNKIDSFKNYRIVNLGSYDFYNLQRYISKSEDKMSYFKLLYLAAQFILVQVSLLQPLPNSWHIVVTIIALITDIYFLKSLLGTFFELTRVNSKFFLLLLVVTFVLGWIDKNTWVAVTLVITLISILISDDVWNLFQEDNPLSGRYNTKSNQNIVKKNILILKVELNLYVLILYLIINFLGNNHYTLEFFNLISSSENKICSTSLQAKFFDGLDKLFLALVLYLLYLFYDECRKKSCKKPILDYLIELLRPLFSKIYKDIQKIDLDVIDDYGNLSGNEINKYPELIIRDSKYLPEETKLLFENDNGDNILKIIYPNKEVEIRRIKSFESSKDEY